MTVVVDIRQRKSCKLPAACEEARTEFELFRAMNVAIRQVSDRFDRRAAVYASAVETGHQPRPADAVFVCASLHVFEVRGFMLGQHAADACDVRMAFQKLYRGGEESRLHLHVAVDQPDVSPFAVLEPELGA